MTMKLYCEPGALSAELRSLQHRGLVSLVHFSFDPGSHSRKLSHDASPAGAEWQDLGYTWDQLTELGMTWADFIVKGRLADIQGIIGPDHRRDALHVNSAFLSGCPAMITRDSDILGHRAELGALLSLRFFHPDHDAQALTAYVLASGAV